MDRESIAEAMFGARYGALSSWGKEEVNKVMSKQERIDARPQPTLDERADQMLRLTRELEDAKIENLELWDEISDLKAELEEVRSSWNPPTSS